MTEGVAERMVRPRSHRNPGTATRAFRPIRIRSSPAYAQAASPVLFGSADAFLPLVLIFVVFYFLPIRPQQQKQKDQRQMLAAIKRGDRVITGGGILGAGAARAHGYQQGRQAGGVVGDRGGDRSRISVSP